MLPNKFAILWDNQPIGLDNGSPYKTNDVSSVYFFPSRSEAQHYLDVVTMRGTSTTYISNYKIVEIQFRIMDE